MQVEPQYTIPLVYQLVDPSDTGTYYVRAIIKNSLTGAILQTVPLTSGGSGRFFSSFLAPKDPTGQGFFMDVTIQAYTDSGYSTVAPGYQRETRQFLVKRSQQAWGSGGGDVDYDAIRKVLAKELDHRAKLAAKLAANNKKEEVEEVDQFAPILEALQALQTSVTELCEEEDEEETPVDLSPVIEALEGHTEALKTHVTSEEGTIEPTDLLPVLESIEYGHNKSTETLQNILSLITELKTKSDAKESETLDTLYSMVASHIEKQKAEEKAEEKPEPVPTPFIDNLMRNNK